MTLWDPGFLNPDPCLLSLFYISFVVPISRSSLRQLSLLDLFLPSLFLFNVICHRLLVSELFVLVGSCLPFCMCWEQEPVFQFCIPFRPQEKKKKHLTFIKSLLYTRHFSYSYYVCLAVTLWKRYYSFHLINEDIGTQNDYVNFSWINSRSAWFSSPYSCHMPCCIHTQ